MFNKRAVYESSFNQALSHANGFSIEYGDCAQKDRSNEGAKWNQCCGKANRRKPYSADIGQRCCADKTIYSIVEGTKCCMNGRTMPGTMLCEEEQELSQENFLSNEEVVTEN